MVLSSDEADHPFEYARIIGLFHIDVAFTGPSSSSRAYKRLNIAWVRWFQFDSSYPCGFSAQRLPRIHFLDHSDSEAFGFLDPEQMIRGAHLIPAFSQGKTEDYLPPSLVRCPTDESTDSNKDYRYYYVNM